MFVRYVKVWYLHGLLGKQCSLSLRKAALLLSHVLQRLVQPSYEALNKGAMLEHIDGRWFTFPIA